MGAPGRGIAGGKASWQEAAWPICGWREGQLGPRTESTSQHTGPAPAWGPSQEHRQGASGCFQVNCSQPPSLLNNPGTSVAVAGLGMGGREGQTVSSSHWPQPLKGGHRPRQAHSWGGSPCKGPRDCPWGVHRATILLPWLLAATNPRPPHCQHWCDLCRVPRSHLL